MIDEEFAKSLGLENLDALKNALKSQLSGDLNFATRQQVKRVLLDALDERHSFDLPPLMVKAEFDQIWAQFEQEQKAGRLSEEDKGKSDEELQDRIPARSPSAACAWAWCWPRSAAAPMSRSPTRNSARRSARKPRAIRARRRQVIDFYRQNPNALAQLRAPIYEEKVVDYILGKATVTDKTVSREELMKEVGDE